MVQDGLRATDQEVINTDYEYPRFAGQFVRQTLHYVTDS